MPYIFYRCITHDHRIAKYFKSFWKQITDLRSVIIARTKTNRHIHVHMALTLLVAPQTKTIGRELPLTASGPVSSTVPTVEILLSLFDKGQAIEANATHYSGDRLCSDTFTPIMAELPGELHLSPFRRQLVLIHFVKSIKAPIEAIWWQPSIGIGGRRESRGGTTPVRVSFGWIHHHVVIVIRVTSRVLCRSLVINVEVPPIVPLLIDFILMLLTR